jgi:hypothetical protein
LAGVLVNITPLLSCYKRATSQVTAPQYTPPPPLSSKTTPHINVIPRNSQANSIKDYPITLKKSEDEVDFIEKDNIKINKNKDSSSPTNIPPSKKSFILTNILPPNYPLVNYKAALLVIQSSSQMRRQLRKTVKNKEVSSQ